MNVDLISEFIKEYTKFFNDIKKKNNNDINKPLESCMTNLTLLKNNLSNKDTNSTSEILLSISNCFIEGINHIIDLKYIKNFLNSLLLIKKLIEYNLLSKEKSNEIIIILKSFYCTNKISEECQKKIMEIIQTYIFSEYFELNFNTLSIIYILALKEFNFINNSKNKDYKNPIRLLFTTLTDKIYKSQNNNNVLQITYFIFAFYYLSTSKKQEIKYDYINEELKIEIIDILNKDKNNIYIECLSLELLSQGFNNYINELKKEKNNINISNNELNSFINSKIMNTLSDNINIIKSNYSINEDELNYLHYLKICIFLKILLFNYTINNYDIIHSIIDMINEILNSKNKIIWKLNLSYELIVQIISNYELLSKIYIYNQEIIKNIFSIVINIFNSFDPISLYKDIEECKIRNIFENKIYLEGDEIIILLEDKRKYYKYVIDKNIQILNDSLMKIIEKENDKILNKEIFCVICDSLRNVIFKLLSQEFHNKNSAKNDKIDESYNDIKMYINYIKNLMIIYNKINNFVKQNETLNYLCNLSLDYSEGKLYEDKNIFIALYLLELITEIKLLNKESYVILLQTIEIFNRKFNYLKLNEYVKKDINKIINDMNSFLISTNKKAKKPTKIRIEIKLKEENDESNENEIIEKIEINKEIKKKESQEDSKDNIYKNQLCKKINELFLDKKIYNFETIKCIIDSLCTCIDSSVQKMKNKKQDITNINILGEEKTSNFTYEIKFYFSKIISLTLLYIDNIYILFEPFISVVNKLIDNKLMIEFSVDVLCALIPEILIKYDQIKSSINQNINEENEIWINDKWQKILFSPLLTLLSQPELFRLIRQKIFISIKKIIQQSGNFIDSYGWDSILQTCIILSNYNIENAFLLTKEILNDYNGYLTIFNVIPLMKILKLFICQEKDKNISFSSVELFWSCAKIIDDYKLEKKVLKDNQKLFFNNIINGREIKKYCDDLYFDFFSYLNEINNTTNIDVKKSILNILTEIFISKIAYINDDTCSKIIKDIFFKSFESSCSNYISNNKNEQLEKNLEISLFSIIKIIKEYLNSKEKQVWAFEKYLNKIIEIIPVGSNILISEILKSLIDIKISKNSNIPIIKTKNDISYQILSLIILYLKSPNFILDMNIKPSIYRLFRSILSFIDSILDEEIKLNKHIKDVFTIIDLILNFVSKLESKLLESKPGKIMDFENEIFEFLEKTNVKNSIIIEYLLDKINLDIKNQHNNAIYKKCFETCQNLLNKMLSNNKGFGINKEEKNIIYKYIQKIKSFMNLRNDKEIIEFLFNSNNDKNNIKDEINFNKYLESFIKIINDVCINFLKVKEEKSIPNGKEINEIINYENEIFLLTLDLFELMFKQSISGYQSIDKSHHSILVNEIYQQMDITSSNFILNKLFFFILLTLGNEKEKNDAYDKVQKKLIHIIKLISDIYYDNNDNNFGDNSFISLNQYFINELFKLCKYKTKEEIINLISNYNIKIDEEKYVQNYIYISKILTNLLIKKTIDILKKYREDENKSGDMPLNRGRIFEITSLLNNVKELEIYPNFNGIEKNGFQNKIEEEHIINEKITKSKKIHLFYIQPILNDFIYCKENLIKSFVKDIFNEIANIINLPKLIDFDK